jgi:hypothetical protein
VQQGVDRRQAVEDAELAAEDRADLGAAERAGGVPGDRPGVQADAEPLGGLVVEEGGPAGAGPVVEGDLALVVVAGDPGLGGAAGAAQGGGDLRGGAALGGQDDRADAEEAPPARRGVGQGAELVECQVIGDVHDGSLGSGPIMTSEYLERKRARREIVESV